MNIRGRIAAWTLITALLVAQAFMSAEIIGYSTNTLEAHPDWILGKSLLANPIMGSRSAYSTRNLLHRNRLNLGVWHGYQEVLLNRVFRPGTIRFRFRLAENDYTYVLFGKNKDGFSGIRLSRHDGFPSMFVRARPSGEFTEKQIINNLSLSDDWHWAELTFGASDLNLTIDGITIAQIRGVTTEQQIIGFRAGLSGAQIDDVTAYDLSGHMVVDEKFSNDAGFFTILILVFCIMSAGIGVVYRIGVRKPGDNRELLFSILMVCFVITSISATYHAFDYLSWSKKYPYRETQWWNFDLQDHVLIFERLRSAFFNGISNASIGKTPYMSRPEALADFLGLNIGYATDLTNLSITRDMGGEQRTELIGSGMESVTAYLKENALGSAPRILFLGTSQTWGAGANRVHERIAPTVSRILLDCCDLKTTVINGSERGSRSGELLERYEHHIHLLSPDLVVVNLANNDGDRGTFEYNLQALIDLNRRLGAETLFVMEAVSPWGQSTWMLNMHAVMSQVADRNSIRALDLNEFIAGRNVNDSGILWWDNIHMTSYGQAKAAAFIAAEIVDILSHTMEELNSEEL